MAWSPVSHPQTVPQSLRLRSLTIAAVVVFAVGASVFVVLERDADLNLRVDAGMAELTAAINRLDALEWRAIASGRITDEIRTSLAANRARAEVLLAPLTHVGTDDARHVIGHYVEYRVAVDRELRLIERGRFDEARELDESTVDPAFVRVFDSVSYARRRIRDAGERAAGLSQAGAVLALLAALVVIAFMSWWAQRTLRKEARTRREQEVMRESNLALERANAELVEAARMKSEFLANMSHELRTPLTGLLGFLELLNDGLCSSLEEQRDFIGRSQVCGKNLLRLINELLDMAKIEAGKMSLAIERVDVGETFGYLSTQFTPQADARGLRLIFEAPETPLAARADTQRVRQVLINLIGNSLKFTPQGSISVRTTLLSGSGDLLFEVIDTGIGVPHDRQRAVFEPFIQGDGSTTRRYGGTGIGLTICRTFVEMMGGAIAMESEGEGRGTRMCFTLPLWVESAPGLGEPAGEERSAA